MSTQTRIPVTEQNESKPVTRRLGGFIKKMVFAFVLTMILFFPLYHVIGNPASLVALFLAGTAVNVYYADPDSGEN